MGGQACNGECHPRNFNLEHEEPELFVRSQWSCIPRIVFLIWRLVWALFFVIWIIMSGVVPYGWYTTESQKIKWGIYLTNWMFFTLTITTLWHLVLVGNAYIQERKGVQPPLVMPWYYKVNWVLYNLSTSIGIMVSALFWGLLYTPEYDLHYISFGTHGINSIYIILDLTITGIPVRIQHFFHGVIYAVVYLVFNIIYSYAGGSNANENPYIYSVMDWRTNPTTAAINSVISIVGVIVIHIIVYALYWIRRVIHAQCCYQKVKVTTSTANYGTTEQHELQNKQDERDEEKGEVNAAVEPSLGYFEKS